MRWSHGDCNECGKFFGPMVHASAQALEEPEDGFCIGLRNFERRWGIPHQRPSRRRGAPTGAFNEVVMSELHTRSEVFAIDRKDFSLYRRNDRQMINFVVPPQR